MTLAGVSASGGGAQGRTLRDQAVQTAQRELACEAAEELGGSLSFEIVDDVAVATLDLPAG